MLKTVTVSIVVDDHEPEKCGEKCLYRDDFLYWCHLFDQPFTDGYFHRCKQCLEEAK